jgi:hypothetical protein
MKKLIIVVATALLAVNAAPVHAHEISSREEYNRVLRNAERFSENITPSVDIGADGSDTKEWIGDGFSLVKHFKYGALLSSFLCVNDDDMTQTCWSDRGAKWVRRLENRYGRLQWFTDGQNDVNGKWNFLREQWPGEPAPQKPDLFK